MIKSIRSSIHNFAKAPILCKFGGLFLLLLVGAFGPPSSIAHKLESLNPLVIGIYDGLWPCTEKDGSGYKGLTIDIWDKIARRHSLLYLIKPLPSIGDLVNAAEMNDVDLIVSCQIISAERASRVDFSVPFSYSSIAILSTKKEVPSLQFATRVLTNERVGRSFLLLVILTFVAASFLKSQVTDDSSLGRIWSVLILGSGVHSLLSNNKRTHIPVLVVASVRLVLVSILVGTSASIVFDEEKPMDATRINREQFTTLMSEGLGVVSNTATESWVQKRMSDLRISAEPSDIKFYPSEEAMIQSLKSGDINHIVTYNIRFPYYMYLLGEKKSYHASYQIESKTPIAFIFSSGLSQPLRRLINSELASLNHDGTIANIEKYWADSLD